MNKILKSIRLIRWQLGHTIPMIVHHISAHPELPRKSIFRRYLENLYLYLRDGVPCLYYDGMGMDIVNQKVSDYVNDFAWVNFLYKSWSEEKTKSDSFDRSILESTMLPLLHNKYLFWSYLERHKIPVVPVLAHSIEGNIYSLSNIKLVELDRFFVKATNAICGLDVFLVTVENGRFLLNGEEIDISTIVKKHDYIFQPAIENHPEIKVINPTALNTVRLVTCRKKDRTLELFDSGALRTGRANVNVDNLAQGGIGIGIDEDGRLKRYGYTYDKNYCYSKLEIHPDSNIVFEGRSIPFYWESVDLVLKAHELFPNIKTIGWDVAITSDGPLLLEANHNWGVVMQQVVHQKGAASRLKEIYGKI